MIATSVSEFLWTEAIATSIYIHNRIPNKKATEITACEAIFGRKPEIGHIKNFGCTAYQHIPKQQRGAWDAKCIKTILVGYDSVSSNYLLYDPERQTINIARNVTFKEKAVEYF